MPAPLLSLQARLVLGRPRLVLAAALALAVAAVLPVLSLPIITARIALVPRDDPSVTAFQEFNRTFGAVHTVFAVVEGPPARALVDEAAAALRRRPEIRAVSARFDLPPLEAAALRAMPADQVRALSAELALMLPVLRHTLADPSPVTFVKELADLINDPETPAPGADEAKRAAELIGGFARTLAHAVDPALPPAELFAGMDPIGPMLAARGLDEGGYLVSRDGRRLLMLISPRTPPDDPESGAALLAAIHAAVDPALARHPGASISFGGAPVQDALEQDTVTRDVAVTSLWAALITVALSLLAFRSIPVALIANGVLAFSVLLTLAAARLLVGHLNVISTVFVPVLVGVGIDFGIFLFQLYLDALPAYGERALEHALLTGTPGILVGAATPAAAFLSLTLHRFPAFHDLGLIAGTGMLLAVAAMLVVFPAVVRVLEPRLRPLADRPPAPLSRLLPRITAPGRYAVPLAWALAVGALALTPAAPFDYDINNLQAAASESNRTEQRLHADFGLSSKVIMIRTLTIAAAARLTRALAARPEVGPIDGAALLIPAEAPPPEVAELLGLARELPPAAPAPRQPADRAGMLVALDAMRGALTQLGKLSKMEESTALASAQRAAERDLAAARAAVEHAAAPAPALAGLARRIAAELGRVGERLAVVDHATPYTAATLPPELASRYLAPDGSLATYVWPAHDVSDRATARAFVDAVQAVTASVPGASCAGTPIMECRMLDMIRNGFAQAAWLALGIIVAMVMVDFRSLRLTVLGLLPMACGTVAALGVLALSGRAWNPVNSMALPVLFGEGVGFGVNLVHRWLRERSVDVAIAGTGRAVIYCGGTSIAGFGSLLFAQHRGLSSFGFVMAVGTLGSALTGLVLLPRVLSWMDPE